MKTVRTNSGRAMARFGIPSVSGAVIYRRGLSTRATVVEKLWVLAVAGLAISLFIHSYDLWTPGLLDRSGRIKGSDYMRLYATGRLAHEGRWAALFVAPAHVDAVRRRVDPRIDMTGLHPNYGPTAAWLLAPWSRLPFLTSWVLFSAASAILMFIGLWAVLGQTRHLACHRGLALVAAAAFPALFESFRYGQLSALTTALFAVGAALSLGGRAFTGGAVLGLAFYKPNLVAPVLVVAIASRRWRLAGGVVTGIAAHLLIGLGAGGLAPTVRWFEVLAILGRAPELVQAFPAEQHSLLGFLRLLGLAPATLTAVSVLAAAIVILFCVRVWRSHGHDGVGWAAGVLATLLATPHLLTYDLLLLVIPLILVLDRVLSRRDHKTTWLLILAALYLAPLVSPVVAGIIRVQLSTVAMVFLFVSLVKSTSATPPLELSSDPLSGP